MDLPVVSTAEAIAVFPPETSDMLIAVGYSDMRNRELVINRIASEGYTFTNLIPKDRCDGIINGNNNIIMPGSIIEPFVTIGSNNIIWSGAHICHDASVEDNNFFAAGSILGGYVNVSKGSFFGFNSVVIENLTIAEESFIAAGAVIINDTEPYSKYMGVPAKKTGEHADTGIVM